MPLQYAPIVFQGGQQIKKDVLSNVFLFYLWERMDSLFCGKATAVATVHRTVAKSRLSNPFLHTAKMLPPCSL